VKPHENFVCLLRKRVSKPLAEALLKKLRPDLEVDSAGLHGAIPISGQVKAFLAKRDAVQYLKQFPQSIDEKDLPCYDLIVVMEPVQADAVLRACPDCKPRIVTWKVEDPYFLAREDAEDIYVQVENKVEELAKHL